MSKFAFLQTKNGLIVVIILSLVIGFFGGMEFKSYQVRRAIEETFSPTEVAIDINKEKIINKNMGDIIELTTVSYKINGAKEQQMISSANMFSTPVTAKNGAKFVVIDIGITNTTNSSFYVPTDGFMLIDNSDRIFQPFDNTIGNIDNYLNSRKLSPSIEETGVLVFQIPQDATQYSLVTAKAGTDEVYKTRLK